MDNFKIMSEGFIFVDSEGNKSLRADVLDEICEVGYFIQVIHKNKSYAASCPVHVQTFFDSEGAARQRAREICLANLRAGLK